MHAWVSNACLLLLGDPAHKIWQVKFILLQALRYYFRTFAQQRRLVCGDGHKFFVRQRSHLLDTFEYAGVFLSVSQLTQKILPSCFRPRHTSKALFGPHTFRALKFTQVVHVTLFKTCFGRTYIYFWSKGAVHFYSCFTHNAVGEVMPVQWTPFRLAAITAPRLAAALLFCTTYMGIVLFNYTSHAGHTTEAHIDRVPIKHFL